MRDLFYNRAVPGPMLNIGLHLDRIRPEDGGLRLLPGTHRDTFFWMAFRKAYFMDNRPDPREVAVETWPGDLTVHDGRAWHRVQASPHQGWRSLRTSLYIPYVNDAYQPKDEHSKGMWYLRVFDKWLQLRKKLGR
jgi:ectoine hydroxylase-related dioxygenase (phytanoyl-CoA dioxygenase family)